MSGFGERLRKLRRDANMTQSQLADKVGVVTAAISKYEVENSKAYPTVEGLIKIAEFFDVSIDYLLLGKQHTTIMENSIGGDMNNSSVIQGGTVIGERALSPETSELVNIYERLNGRARLKLLNFAVELEEGKSK